MKSLKPLPTLLAAGVLVSATLALTACSASVEPTPTASRSAYPSGTSYIGKVCLRNETGGPMKFNFAKGTYTKPPFSNQTTVGELAKHQTVCNTGLDFEILVKLPDLENFGTVLFNGGSLELTLNGVYGWANPGSTGYVESEGYRMDFTPPKVDEKSELIYSNATWRRQTYTLTFY